MNAPKFRFKQPPKLEKLYKALERQELDPDGYAEELPSGEWFEWLSTGQNADYRRVGILIYDLDDEREDRVNRWEVFLLVGEWEPGVTGGSL